MNTPTEPLRAPQDSIRGSEQLPATPYQIAVQRDPGILILNAQCTECAGHGRQSCADCGESGREESAPRYPASGGVDVDDWTCRTCDGEGFNQCECCEGAGLTEL